MKKNTRIINSPLVILSIVMVILACSCRKDENNNDNSKRDNAIAAITYGTLTDQNGYTYVTVTIGTQTWMAQNLRATKYNDGTAITNAENDDDWSSLTTGGYCYYNNDADYAFTYGALYNWDAVKTGKLAPIGWHVPSDDEWLTLVNYLKNHGFGYGGDNDVAKAIASNAMWNSSSINGAIGNCSFANNTCDFRAYPAGFRTDKGAFNDSLHSSLIGIETDWWCASSSDDAHFFQLSFNRAYYTTGSANKRNGFSIRCVKD